MTKGKLTEKQRRFVEAYMGAAKGSATEAARLAGYKGNANTLATVGAENMRKHAIKHAIDMRVEADPKINGRVELQQFWSRVMDGGEEDAEMKDRLKASELLGKSQAVFVERKEITGKDGGPIETQAKADPRLEKLDDAEFDEVEAALDEFIDTCATVN